MAFRYSAPQIKTNSPKNIAPLTRFIVPTMRKGDSSKNGGSVLHRQAQRGKLVVPLATATSRDSTKTSKPKYQRNMAAEVPLKKPRRPLVPPLSDPAAGKTTLSPRRTHDAPRQAGRTARTLPASAQPTAWKTAHPLAQRQIPRKRRRQSEHPSHCRTHSCFNGVPPRTAERRSLSCKQRKSKRPPAREVKFRSQRQSTKCPAQASKQKRCVIVTGLSPFGSYIG